MSKRSATSTESRPVKRQKVNGVPSASAEQISSARQLQLVLTFQQDALEQFRTGIRSFKAFLEAILYSQDRSSTVSQQRILQEYLESQLPDTNKEDATPMLSNIFQAWGFAAQVNHDSLASAISTILALLLKTMSNFIDFRQLGIKLCTTILQRDRLKLVSRSLSAQRQKEHLISPSIRLLTEIVTYDGGTLAGRVFGEKAKSFTFDGKILSRNLCLWRALQEDGHEDKRKPAVRSNAVRYLLAHLRHQSTAARAEILKYGNVTLALFEHLHHDPSELLAEVLDTLKVHVLDSPKFPRSVKSFVLHERNLAFLVNVLRSDDATIDSGVSARKLADDFLTYVGTVPEAGVLRAPAGWYPPGTEKDQSEALGDDDSAEIHLGLESVEWFNRFQNNVTVRNGTLAALAQQLKPTTSSMESELLQRIFESAPELVADYFFKKKDFSFDPKLSATWVAYASFLFSAVRQPVPRYFGTADDYHSVPPPTSIVLENLLPQPLTQKILTRCLNQQHSLITFLAIRILVAALQKLQIVLSMYNDAAEVTGSLWQEGSRRLLEDFAKRCPPMKEIISTYRKTSREEDLQREAVLRLLSLYFQVLPHLAAEEKFDISDDLANELALLNDQEVDKEDDASKKTEKAPNDRLRNLMLDHLLAIAAHSSDIRWFHQPASKRPSPFMAVLMTLVFEQIQRMSTTTWNTVKLVLEDSGVVQAESEQPGFMALFAALKPDHANRDDWSPNHALLEFLNDAIARTHRKPIKYEDDLDEICDDIDRKAGPVSLVHLAIAEQWPFVLERAKNDDQQDTGSDTSSIARFIGRYIALGKAIGEDEVVLEVLAERARTFCIDAHMEEQMQSMDPLTPQHALDLIQDLMRAVNETSEQTKTQDDPAEKTSAAPCIPYDLLAPPAEHSEAPGLHSWTDKDIPSAIADSDLASLILCLSSSDMEIQQAALRNLRTFSTNLNHLRTTNPTTFPDAPQYQLLLGILINTVTPLLHPAASQALTNGTIHLSRATTFDSDSSSSISEVPAILTTYAALATLILTNPLHPMYAPICDFHLKGPKWDPERLASYWVHTLLYTPAGDEKGLLPSSATSSYGAGAAGLMDGDGVEEAAEVSKAVLTANVETPMRFLLQLVYLSIRDSATLTILRSRNTLEPLLAMAANPNVRHETLDMLAKILWRITFLEGGSDVLITRVGMMAWLQARIIEASAREEAAGTKGKKSRRQDVRGGLTSAPALRMLVKRIWETCDRERVGGWSDGLIQSTIEGLAGAEVDVEMLDAQA